MGWWEIGPGGMPLVWGDTVADVFDDAINEIAHLFQEQWGRKPTHVELQNGLLFALATYDQEPDDEVDPDPPLCVDCGTDTNPTNGQRSEFYMVHDEVWAAAGIEPNGGCLCVGCLEKRLGRKLWSGDFRDVPINDLTNQDGEKAFSWRTPRLVNRMTATGKHGVLDD